MNMADESELPSQAITVLLGHQRNMHAVFCYPGRRLCIFPLLNPRWFSSSVAFS